MSSDRKNCERATTQFLGLGGMMTNKAVDAFVRNLLTLHTGDPGARLTMISMDLPPTFQKCGAGHLPKAQTTYGRFYIVALTSGAMDAARRRKVHQQSDLKARHQICMKSKNQKKMFQNPEESESRGRTVFRNRGKLNHWLLIMLLILNDGKP